MLVMFGLPSMLEICMLVYEFGMIYFLELIMKFCLLNLSNRKKGSREFSLSNENSYGSYSLLAAFR